LHKKEWEEWRAKTSNFGQYLPFGIWGRNNAKRGWRVGKEEEVIFTS
jgi:hypothetical protein